MERNIKTNGLVNLLVMLVTAGAGLAIAQYTGTLAGQVGAAFLVVGFLVCLFSYFQMRLVENEHVERLELDALARKTADASLFQRAGDEAFPARRALEQFEKYFLPGITLLLLLLQAGGAVWLWRWLAKIPPVLIKDPVIALSSYGLCFLLLFLLGKYASGIARMEKQRLLKPGAGYLLLGAYLGLALAIGIGITAYTGFAKTDWYLAKILTVLLGLTAGETLITLLLEVYRPRVKGREARLLYESRLVGLLGQPEGLFTTAAQALDYQFGFKVSDTWAYRFLQQYLGLFVLLQIVVLWMSTCVVIIDPGEQGILERFGKPAQSGGVLEPGPHFKLPWPMDKLYRYRTRQVQSFNIGFTAGGADHHEEKAILWSVEHYKDEYNMLVASRDQQQGSTSASPTTDTAQAVPVNLLAVNIPVQYQITNVAAWATNYAEAGQVLEKVASREAVRYLVNVDVNEIMTIGRQKAGEDLKQHIQAQANEMNLGVKIVFVGLQGIHPPVKIAPAYQSVVAAEQEKAAKILQAQGYQARTVPLAEAEAARKLRTAEAYRERTKAAANAQASQFSNKMAASSAAPEVYAQRAYLQALVRGAADSRKYIIATTNTDEVIQLNLEDKLRPDILTAAEMALPSTTAKDKK